MDFIVITKEEYQKLTYNQIQVFDDNVMMDISKYDRLVREYEAKENDELAIKSI